MKIKQVLNSVNSKHIRRQLRDLYHRKGPGRPVEYDPKWDLKALILRQILQIPYVKDLVKRLRRNPYLRNICGYGDRAPTEAHYNQMKKHIGAEGFRIIETWVLLC